MSSTPSSRSIADQPPHRRVLPLTLVALGGALGAAARYGVSAAWSHHGRFDWPILLINCLGAVFLGGLLECLSRRGPDEGLRQHLRLLIGTGFCGAFTTYSTFAHDVMSLSRDSGGEAAAWGISHVVLGFCSAFLGAWLGAHWAGRRRGERL